MTEFSGQFITTTPHQENFWISKSELAKSQTLKPIDGLDLDDRTTPLPLLFREDIARAQGY